MTANNITGPNAGGPRQFLIRTSLAARVGQFRRSARKEPMATQRRVQSGGPRVGTWVLGMFLLVTTAWAQGLVEYRFRGQVTQTFPPGGFPIPAATGTSVDGSLFIDYRALDSTPDPNYGNYESEFMGWRVRFGAGPGFHFVTDVQPGNVVEVHNGVVDTINLYSPPAVAGAEGWSLSLYDPAGRALASDALPASIDDLRGFTEAFMSVAGFLGPDQYYETAYSFSVTFVPEPSVVVVSGVGLALLGILRCRSRSAVTSGRLDAERGAPPNGGPATSLGNSGVTEGPPSVS